jgi:hypothetical protein
MAPETEKSSSPDHTTMPLLGQAPSRPEVYANIHSIDNLNSLAIDRMFQLMQLHYENIHFEQFKADLMEKDDVILLHDKESKVIQGFSTLLKVPMTVNKKQIIGVFSGDTVLNKSYWGTTALGKAFLKYLWQVKATHLSKPTYWFLISKGYKTYLLMANNFKTHYPRFEKSTPQHFKDVMNAFYSKKFSENYIAKNDLIRFTKPSCHLKGDIAEISPTHLKIPRVRFFQSKNPNWHKGDELTCIAEMTFWMPLAYSIKKLFKGIFQ